MSHMLHLEQPTDLDAFQLRAALADLCRHGVAVMETRCHARQLYAMAARERLEVRLPVSIGAGWRVELA